MTRRQGRRRAAVSRAECEVVRPTRETVAKLRRDLVEQLYAKGRLRQEHLEAAEEIRTVWQAFSRGLGASAMNPVMLALPSRPLRSAVQPVERLTPREERLWRTRYRPWAGELSAKACGGGENSTQLRIVVDLAVDNRKLRQVEGWYRLRHGAAFEHLRNGLHRYAEIAGWIGP